MKILQPATTTLALLLGLAWSAPQASADWVETFTGGLDNPSWFFFDDSGPGLSDTSMSTSGDVLTLQGNLTANYDLVGAGVVTGETFTDVLVRATVSPTTGTTFTGDQVTSNNDMFVVARSDGNQGYLLSIDYNDGDIDLGYVQGLAFTAAAPTVENPAWFDPSASYVLELLVHGTNLRGRVFDEMGGLLAELNGSDATLSSGWSGLGASVNNDSIAQAELSLVAAVFDNVSSTAVPEPSTLLLALGGVFGMVEIRRRRSA